MFSRWDTSASVVRHTTDLAGRRWPLFGGQAKTFSKTSCNSPDDPVDGGWRVGLRPWQVVKELMQKHGEAGCSPLGSGELLLNAFVKGSSGTNLQCRGLDLLHELGHAAEKPTHSGLIVTVRAGGSCRSPMAGK